MTQVTELNPITPAESSISDPAASPIDTANTVDATAAVDISGVDFIEFSGPDALYFEGLFKKWAFREIGTVHGKNIRLFRQGHINFILNCEPHTFAQDYAQIHGPSITTLGFRVANAEQALRTAVARGAKAYEGNEHQKGGKLFPAIYGVGESLIWFMDEENQKRLYEEIFAVAPEDLEPEGFGLTQIDHFSNNVGQDEMQKYCDFYRDIFAFKDAEGVGTVCEKSGRHSKAMQSPNGSFVILVNEPSGEDSQVTDYLQEYKGAGWQQVAMNSKDIVHTVESLRTAGVELPPPPSDEYYETLKTTSQLSPEKLEAFHKNGILLQQNGPSSCLQILTKNCVGPIFFEVIEKI